MTLHESTRVSPELWAKLYRAEDGEQQPISIVEREFGLETQRKRHGLELMRPLMDALGAPHLQYPVIHITGSKGKGSTAAIIASILKAAGLRVGLYTSPSLTTFHERIQLNGIPISDQELHTHVQRLLAALERNGLPRPRFFEAATAIAFCYFAEQQVDVAVIEVGIGGRRDATNVVQPGVSVITSIELEHTALLGDTVEQIAAEKGGIIKHPAPVVSGVSEGSARDVLLAIAESQRVPFYELGSHFRLIDRGAGDASQSFDIELGEMFPCRVLRGLRLNLPGAFQRRNAAVAVAAILSAKDMAGRVEEAAIRRGLEEVVWPGRLELRELAGTPVLLDVAHTAASMTCLCDYVRTSFAASRPRVLVLGMLRDKPLDRIIPVLAPEFDLVICAPVKWYRSADPEVLAQACLAAGAPCRTAASVREAVASAVTEAQGGIVVVAGSVFAVGEAKRAFGWL